MYVRKGSSKIYSLPLLSCTVCTITTYCSLIYLFFLANREKAANKIKNKKGLFFGMMRDVNTRSSTNHHHNFSVNTNFRTYYSGVPDLIQVGEH